jgi:hypothetical protein
MRTGDQTPQSTMLWIDRAVSSTLTVRNSSREPFLQKQGAHNRPVNPAPSIRNNCRACQHQSDHTVENASLLFYNTVQSLFLLLTNTPAYATNAGGRSGERLQLNLLKEKK